MSTETSWLGSMPETYDRCLGPALFAPYAQHLAVLAAAAAPARVLELAAGTGIVTAELVRCLPTAEIIATDLNPAMVSWAQERVTGATWQQADAQELGFADGSFDLVVCQFGIMFLPDKRAALAETARVLAPGGSALFTAWDVVETSEFPAALGASLAVVLPDDPPTFVARVPHGYTDRDQMTADFESAGLQSIRVERVVLRGRAPSAGVLAEGFCLGTPLRFALEERGQVEVLTAAVAREMTVRLGAGPVEGDLAAFVITARKAGGAQT